MNKLDLIEQIRFECNKQGITAYRIAQGTGLSSVGVQKIINLETKNPSMTTLNSIINFINGINNTQNSLSEPNDSYNIAISKKDEIIETLNRQIEMKDYIIKLLEEKIKYHEISNKEISEEEQMLKNTNKKGNK